MYMLVPLEDSPFLFNLSFIGLPNFYIVLSSSFSFSFLLNIRRVHHQPLFLCLDDHPVTPRYEIHMSLAQLEHFLTDFHLRASSRSDDDTRPPLAQKLLFSALQPRLQHVELAQGRRKHLGLAILTPPILQGIQHAVLGGVRSECQQRAKVVDAVPLRAGAEAGVEDVV